MTIPPEPQQIKVWHLPEESFQVYLELRKAFDLYLSQEVNATTFQNNGQCLSDFLRTSLKKHPELFLTVDSMGCSLLVFCITIMKKLLVLVLNTNSTILGCNRALSRWCDVIRFFIASNPHSLVWSFNRERSKSCSPLLYLLKQESRYYLLEQGTFMDWILENFGWTFGLIDEDHFAPHIYLLEMSMKEYADPSLVKLYLESTKPDPFVRRPWRTILHYCLYFFAEIGQYCYPDLFELLVDQSPQVLTEVDSQGRTPLFYAMECMDKLPSKGEYSDILEAICVLLIKKSPTSVLMSCDKVFGILPLDNLHRLGSSRHLQNVAIEFLKKYYAWSPGYTTKMLPSVKGILCSSDQEDNEILSEVQHLFDTNSILSEEFYRLNCVSELLDQSNAFVGLGEAYASWVSHRHRQAKTANDALSEAKLTSRIREVATRYRGSMMAGQQSSLFRKWSLSNITPQMQRDMFGRRLYRIIYRTHPYLAGNIIGMILELEVSVLQHLLDDPNELNIMIGEVLLISS
jgi:hypothetical protein